MTQNSINNALRNIGGLKDYQILATRTGINGQAGFVPTSAYAGIQGRIRHTLPYGAKSIILVYGGFKVASAVEGSMLAGAGYKAVSATVVAGGVTYAVGDTIVPNVAANQFAPTLVVSAVSAGVVTQLTVLEGGMFGLFPTGTLTQNTTSGSGTGCTVTLACDAYVCGLHSGFEQVWNTQTAYSNTNTTGVIKVTKGATYNGTQANLMLPCGDFFFTDPIPVNLAAGSVVGSRTYSNGYNIAGGRPLSGSDGIALNEYAQYSDFSDKAWGGTYSTNISAYLNTGFQPLAILGQIDVPKPSFVFIGDSIAQGLVSAAGPTVVGDTFDANANVGWIEKAAAQTVPWANYSSSGDRVINYLTAATNMRLRAIQTFRPSHFVDEIGINDFVASTSYATFLTQKTSFWNKILSFGVKELWVSTITPVTTSSDSFATLVNQTVTASNTARASYNAFLRALTFPNAYGITKVLDVAAAIEDGGAGAPTGKWNVGHTLDGTHPTASGMTAMTSAVSSYFGAATL